MPNTHFCLLLVPAASENLGRGMMSAIMNRSSDSKATLEESSLRLGYSNSGSGAATYYGATFMADTTKIALLEAVVAKAGVGEYYVWLASTTKLTHTNSATAAILDTNWSLAASLADTDNGGRATMAVGATANTFSSITATVRYQNRAICTVPGGTTYLAAASLTGAMAFFASGLNASSAPNAAYSRATIRVSGALTGDRVTNLGLQTLTTPVTSAAQFVTAFGTATFTLTGGLTEGSTSITSGSSITTGWKLIADDTTVTNSDGATSYLTNFEIIYVSSGGTTATIVGEGPNGGLTKAYDGANPVLYDITTMVQGADFIFDTGGSFGYTGSSELFNNRFCIFRDVTVTGIAGTTVGSGYTGAFVEQVLGKVSWTNVQTQASNSAVSSARAFDEKGCHDTSYSGCTELGNPSDGSKPHIFINSQQGTTDCVFTNITGVNTFEWPHAQKGRRCTINGLSGFTVVKFGNPSATDGWPGGAYSIDATFSLPNARVDVCGGIDELDLRGSCLRVNLISFTNASASPTTSKPGVIRIWGTVRNTTNTADFYAIGPNGTNWDITSLTIKSGATVRNDATQSHTPAISLEGTASGPLNMTLTIDSGATIHAEETAGYHIVLNNGVFAGSISSGATFSGGAGKRIRIRSGCTGTLTIPTGWTAAGYVQDDSGGGLSVVES